MNNIIPVSDLRNYPSVLEKVSPNNPVILTKNGRGSYVIMEIAEFEEYSYDSAALKLLTQLQEADLSGKQFGWVDSSEVFKDLKARFNEK